MSQNTPEPQILWINGKEIQYKAIAGDDSSLIQLSGDFEISTVNLIRKWLTGEINFEFSSSGSTVR